ncbi:hypothetical protein Pyn_38108 [Prunus yedoensis var. nudiflora]|uniref:Uncharacterized protein n=1 Tax=Prunus yedoensis var. nudiflora TaxID=2094558 RepID=A0A314UIW7_PRUYE|nr:hypothetical protein Pyn_38108 [Prunus yedoensis var. nudiflora]
MAQLTDPTQRRPSLLHLKFAWSPCRTMTLKGIQDAHPPSEAQILAEGPAHTDPKPSMQKLKTSKPYLGPSQHPRGSAPNPCQNPQRLHYFTMPKTGPQGLKICQQIPLPIGKGCTEAPC